MRVEVRKRLCNRREAGGRRSRAPNASWANSGEMEIQEKNKSRAFTGVVVVVVVVGGGGGGGGGGGVAGGWHRWWWVVPVVVGG